MPLKSVFEKKGTVFFSLGILQEPEFREDPLPEIMRFEIP